jgi:TolB protein
VKNGVRLIIVAVAPVVLPLTYAQHQVVMFSMDRTPVHSQFFIANGDGTGERVLLPSSGMDYSPSFSSDGQWVVFTSQRDGSADIYRVHPDGTGMERLTDDPAFDDQAVLSPDARSLAFVSTRGSGRARLWVMDIASRGARLLTQGEGGDFDRRGRLPASGSRSPPIVEITRDMFPDPSKSCNRWRCT